jgi:hypothetical protein
MLLQTQKVMAVRVAVVATYLILLYKLQPSDV